MKKPIAIVLVFFVLLLLNVPNVFAQNETTREIDRIETTENSKTIHYKDGSKHMFMTASATINVESQSHASYSILEILPPPNPFPFEKLFDLLEMLKNLLAPIGVASILLATIILHRIKGLRHNRPKDYNRIEIR